MSVTTLSGFKLDSCEYRGEHRLHTRAPVSESHLDPHADWQSNSGHAGHRGDACLRLPCDRDQ